MGNSIEQIAAGVYIVAIIGFVILCNRIKDWLCGIPHVSMKQRDRIRVWQQRQIIKRRDDSAFIPLMGPTESELDQEKAEIAAEIAARERRQAAEKEAAPSAQLEVAPQDILFEDGQVVIRPHVHLEEMPVSTLRLTFQDGKTLDIPSNLEFVGLDEEGFRAAYDAFLKTQAELRGLKGLGATAQQQILARTRPVATEHALTTAPRFLPLRSASRCSSQASRRASMLRPIT